MTTKGYESTTPLNKERETERDRKKERTNERNRQRGIDRQKEREREKEKRKKEREDKKMRHLREQADQGPGERMKNEVQFVTEDAAPTKPALQGQK